MVTDPAGVAASCGGAPTQSPDGAGDHEDGGERHQAPEPPGDVEQRAPQRARVRDPMATARDGPVGTGRVR
jgi:hypothetical protein